MSLLLAIALVAAAPVTNPSQITFTGSAGTRRALADKLADVVSVKDYGAKDDCSVDAAPAFNAAIAAVSRTPVLTTENNLGDSGRIVFIPAGCYLLNSTVVIQHDGVSLLGEGPAASVLKPNANTLTDTIQLGPISGSFSGRRSFIAELGINNPNTTTSRDGISITDTTYWRIRHVVVSQAGRYGVSIVGTHDGRADDLRTDHSGDSGVFIGSSAISSTGETTSHFTRLYTASNQHNGMLIRAGEHVTLESPIFEFNGLSGVEPAEGLKIGDQTAGRSSEVTLIAPYFESNAGWDLYCGDVNSSTLTSRVRIYGMHAVYDGTVAKIGAALHSRMDYCVENTYGAFISYLGQPAGLVQFNQYATDPRGASGSFFSTLTGITGVSSATLPVYFLDGVSTDINKFSGRIEWPDASSNLAPYGRAPGRIGGPGGTVAAIQLTRDTAVPTVGTYGVADLAINSAANVNGGNRALAFRNTAAGTPGTWETLWARMWRAGRVGLTYTSGVAMALDATAGDWFSVSISDAVAYSFTAPTGGITGQEVAVTIKNTSGGALNAGDPFPAGMKHSAWTAPANAQNRSVIFRFDGTNWTQIAQTGVDVPN